MGQLSGLELSRHRPERRINEIRSIVERYMWIINFGNTSYVSKTLSPNWTVDIVANSSLKAINQPVTPSQRTADKIWHAILAFSKLFNSLNLFKNVNQKIVLSILLHNLQGSRYKLYNVSKLWVSNLQTTALQPNGLVLKKVRGLLPCFRYQGRTKYWKVSLSLGRSSFY